MFIRVVSLSLVAFLLVPAAVSRARAATDTDRADAKHAKLAAKVKTAITRLGTGPDARVTISLRDRTQLDGYVSAADDHSFVITAASGVGTTVQYADVTKVRGQNLRTRWKVVIGAAIVAGIIITLYIVRGAFCDGC